MIAETIFTMYERLQSPANWRRTLFVIFTAALVIRIAFIFTLQDGYYFADAPIYSAAASHLLEHGEFPENFDRAPLYPIFLAGVYGLIGEGVIIPRIVQSVLGACIAVLLAVIGRKVGGPGVGTIAGVLWCIYTMGIFIAGLTYPTTLVALLLLLGVLCVLSEPCQKRYPAKVALSGLLFGLAALTKPIVLGTVILMTLWILFWRKPGRILLAGIFICTTVATLAPCTIRNAYVYDRLVPIEARALNKATPWAKVPRRPGESENKTWRYIYRIANRYPAQFVSFFELYPRRVNFLKQEVRDKVHERDPRYVKHTSLGSSLVMAVSIVSVGTLYVFALVGAWAVGMKKEKRPEFTLFVVMVMSFALGYALTDGKIRYRIPVDPYIIFVSSWGLMYVWGLLADRKRTPAQGQSPEPDH
jgi:4-amino-4-deoxy-L-arabinose transferase-like glycosyltransferase